MREIVRTILLLAAAAAWTGLWTGGIESLAGEQPTSITAPASPAAIEPVDLRGVEARITRVLEACRAATVHVEIASGLGVANGSGVIVSPDGYVLTAAHVSGQHDRRAMLTFADGRRVRGITLGRLNFGAYGGDADAGLIRITDPGTWPTAPMGNSTPLSPGDWCFALGHPGGYDPDRGAVLRVGRVIRAADTRLWTDCVLLGGDSGGPLFDLEGRVIGIHSAIARPQEANFHAPIDAFRANWTRLTIGSAILGVQSEPHEKGARVTLVAESSAAQQCGLQIGDVITSVDGAAVTRPDKLTELILAHEPGDTGKLGVIRDGQPIELHATFGATFEVFPQPPRTPRPRRFNDGSK